MLGSGDLFGEDEGAWMPGEADASVEIPQAVPSAHALASPMRYIKPLWLIEEEKRLQSQLRELKTEDPDCPKCGSLQGLRLLSQLVVQEIDIIVTSCPQILIPQVIKTSEGLLAGESPKLYTARMRLRPPGS